MVFDSKVFIIFFLAFFIIYRAFNKNIKIQNTLILIASYYFYGSWNWKYLGLIFFSSLIDYICSIQIYKKNEHKKAWLLISIFVNLGSLGLFKYYNFFSSSLSQALETVGLSVFFPTVDFLLPVGISFYTFQSMSYTIDIYRGVSKPEKNLLTFLTYISFFPQLVAGPIERAHHLLPQFYKRQDLNSNLINKAIWLLLWGYFLKIVVANPLSLYVDSIFTFNNNNGLYTIIGTIAFGFQIYADFLGYSLMAKGLATLLGFDLMWNFNRPYFSVSIQEFWRRWHISLSTWLKDYLYIPLGGNKLGRFRTYINLMLTMILGGLWHGASWNFLIWGAIHGVALIIHRFTSKRVKWNFMGNTGSWALTMLVVFSSWFFFRSHSWELSKHLILTLKSLYISSDLFIYMKSIFILILPVIIVELIQNRKEKEFIFESINKNVQSFIYSILLIFIFSLFLRFKNEFIYFQF